MDDKPDRGMPLSQFVGGPLPKGSAILAPSNWEELALPGETLEDFMNRRPELFGVIKNIAEKD